MSDIALTLTPVPWLLIIVGTVLALIAAFDWWYARRNARVHRALNADRLTEWRQAMDDAGITFDSAWRAK